MPDLICSVCGEPWDASGVRTDGSGDMEAWEAVLFLKGAGCPSCEGQPPDEPVDFEDAHMSSRLLHGYDDYGHFDIMPEGPSNVEWRKPEPKLIATCHTCGRKLWEDASRERYAEPDYRWEDASDIDTWERHPEHKEQIYCPSCWCCCNDCAESVFPDEDLYDGGAVNIEGNAYCAGCYEQNWATCSECEELVRIEDIRFIDGDVVCEHCAPVDDDEEEDEEEE